MPTLKDWRERSVLSQGELAKAIGVHPQSVHNWEAGIFVPRPEQRRKLLGIFHCTPDELLAALQETQEAKKKREGRGDNKRAAA